MVSLPLLPGAEGEGAPEGGVLDEDELEEGELLLEDWLLEELDELLEELLLEELLDDGAELGVDGGCGMVGLLALGQPLRAPHAAPTRVSLISTPRRFFPLPACRVICPTQCIGVHRLTAFEARPEPGLAQLPDQAVGLGFVFHAVVDPVDIDHPAAGADPEFYQ